MNDWEFGAKFVRWLPRDRVHSCDDVHAWPLYWHASRMCCYVCQWNHIDGKAHIGFKKYWSTGPGVWSELRQARLTMPFLSGFTGCCPWQLMKYRSSFISFAQPFTLYYVSGSCHASLYAYRPLTLTYFLEAYIYTVLHFRHAHGG